MAALKNLKELALSGNDFSRGLSGVIGEVTSLEVLDLDGCKLPKIPARYDIYNHSLNDFKGWHKPARDITIKLVVHYNSHQ